jgi:hypothetical protein
MMRGEQEATQIENLAEGTVGFDCCKLEQKQSKIQNREEPIANLSHR